MKLYHCKDARSLRPLWTMEEMGLDYELEVMEFPPRFAHEGYTQINPIGTVPFFQDGDVTMTESAGISQYLVDTYGPTELAVQKGESDYGSYLNWIHRSDATLTFPQTVVLRYAIFEPQKGLQAAAEDYTKWFFARLRSVEEALQTREWLCQDRFTIADICVGYSIFLADIGLGLRAQFKPEIEAYYKRFQARPAFKKAVSL